MHRDLAQAALDHLIVRVADTHSPDVKPTPAELLARTRKRKRSPRNRVSKVGPLYCFCRVAREELGLSLDAVAEAIGMSKTAIWQIEHGGDPVLTTALKLAAFYGMPIERLWEKRD